MDHEMTMRLIVFGFVAALFLVGFAMRVDSGGGRTASDAVAISGARGGRRPRASVRSGHRAGPGRVVTNATSGQQASRLPD